jgi:hypothetical protein
MIKKICDVCGKEGAEDFGFRVWMGEDVSRLSRRDMVDVDTPYHTCIECRKRFQEVLGQSFRLFRKTILSTCESALTALLKYGVTKEDWQEAREKKDDI